MVQTAVQLWSKELKVVTVRRVRSKCGPKTVTPFYDTTEILGGKATVYRREPGGCFYWRYWIPAEKKRISKSLKTRDLGAAVQLATERTLEAMAKERTGVKVISGTLADAINAYEAKQQGRLSRGEIRSEAKQRQNVADLRNNCEAVWGLDTPLADMTQARWDEYIEARDDIKLSTIKGHLRQFTSLIRNHGLTLGAPEVPVFDHVVVPKNERAQRKDTITEEQFEELVKALIAFLGFEDQKNRIYKRDFRLGQHKAKPGGGRDVDQKLEAHRRRLLYRFVMVMAASGMRPHEAAGFADKSLRLRDIEDPGYSVESKQLSQRERPVVLLHVRDDTKTGRRTVPAVCGDVIEKIKEDLCVDQSPDAPLFQDLDGKPIRLLTLRLYFNEVCKRMGLWNRSPDFYELRHLWITRRLQEGVPVTTVAKTAGSSVELITTTYAHILLTSEETVRSLYEQQLRGEAN